MPKNKKKFVNIVYSTNPNFELESVDEHVEETLPPNSQKLYVSLDRKNRGGKEATIVEGFIGSEDKLKELGKFLKRKCGVGGSTKNEVIIVQGNFKLKVYDLLIQNGYSKTKMKGG